MVTYGQVSAKMCTASLPLPHNLAHPSTSTLNIGPLIRQCSNVSWLWLLSRRLHCCARTRRWCDWRSTWEWRSQQTVSRAGATASQPRIRPLTSQTAWTRRGAIRWIYRSSADFIAMSADNRWVLEEDQEVPARSGYERKLTAERELDEN